MMQQDADRLVQIADRTAEAVWRALDGWIEGKRLSYKTAGGARIFSRAMADALLDRRHAREESIARAEQALLYEELLYMAAAGFDIFSSVDHRQPPTTPYIQVEGPRIAGQFL